MKKLWGFPLDRSSFNKTLEEIKKLFSYDEEYNSVRGFWQRINEDEKYFDYLLPNNQRVIVFVAENRQVFVGFPASSYMLYETTLDLLYELRTNNLEKNMARQLILMARHNQLTYITSTDTYKSAFTTLRKWARQLEPTIV